MTALMAAIGMYPAATSTGIGSEVQRPLALVILGGMMSAVLLTLLVLPALYEMFESLFPRRGHGARGAGGIVRVAAWCHSTGPSHRTASASAGRDREVDSRPTDGETAMRKLTLVLVCLLAAGCESGYYRVTDVGTGKTYYTQGWLLGMYGRCGTIKFRDLKTGSTVTLRSSEVAEVPEAEVKASPTTAPQDPR